jgi:hypothetical protein
MTPAKKPRTECCCHPVAAMMAAIVVPLVCRSIPSTVSCFEDEPLIDRTEAARATALDFVDLDFSATLVACLRREGFVTRLAFLEAYLLVAIGALRQGDGGRRSRRLAVALRPHQSLRLTQQSSELTSNLMALLQVFPASDAPEGGRKIARAELCIVSNRRDSKARADASLTIRDTDSASRALSLLN